MATTTMRFLIQEVVSAPMTYDLYFEENTAHADQVSMSLPRAWFRNIGRPKKGQVLRIEQSELGTYYEVGGHAIHTAKSQLSYPPEKCMEIMKRQEMACIRRDTTLERLAQRPQA